jgi:hypothetical protein
MPSLRLRRSEQLLYLSLSNLIKFGQLSSNTLALVKMKKNKKKKKRLQLREDLVCNRQSHKESMSNGLSFLVSALLDCSLFLLLESLAPFTQDSRTNWCHFTITPSNSSSGASGSGLTCSHSWQCRYRLAYSSTQ